MDDEILQQEREIFDAEVADKPLFQEIMTAELYGDDVFAESPMKAAVIAAVLKGETGRIHRARRDGNCFLRCFSFGMLKTVEKAAAHPENASINAVATSLLEKAEQSIEVMRNMGYPDFVTEDYIGALVEAINSAKSKQVSFDLVNDAEVSCALIMALRLIIAAELKEKRDFYMGFIEGYHTMESFCAAQVEPMSVECEQVHLIALCSYFNVSVQVEYVTVNGSDSMRLGEGEVVAHVLFTPGHYDFIV